jgi:cytochrome P450
MTTTSPAVPFFDLSDPEFSVRSDEVLAAREQSWFARTNYGIAVLRYDEVASLMRDRRLRQGSRNWPELNNVSGPWAEWWLKALLNLEGADHLRLRRLFNPAFFPRHIQALVPRFQVLAGELIDGFIDAGECEFVSQFADPYAARVISVILGLPEDEWPVIRDYANALGLALGVTIKQDLPKIEAALENLYAYADELLADRRAHPRDDLVTRLVHAQEDEDRLSLDELRVNVVLMIFGGIDTTRNQLGLAMQTFAEHPDQWELLARRPELKEAAVEEVMRVNPTVTWVTREALEDIEFQGLDIPAGTVLHLFSASAGTDPRAYPNPAFDLTVEDRSRHFGFGGGVHHCIGHFVARGDMGEALALLAHRLADLRVGPGATSLPASGNTGPITLPLAFRPRQ